LVSCGTTEQSAGLPIQVIVLIIIGGLLLLTALIGLIAWIVSRRKKRDGYETVA
jgi:flagellar biogenesis protein FliO